MRDVSVVSLLYQESHRSVLSVVCSNTLAKVIFYAMSTVFIVFSFLGVFFKNLILN